MGLWRLYCLPTPPPPPPRVHFLPLAPSSFASADLQQQVHFHPLTPNPCSKTSLIPDP